MRSRSPENSRRRDRSVIGQVPHDYNRRRLRRHPDTPRVARRPAGRDPRRGRSCRDDRPERRSRACAALCSSRGPDRSPGPGLRRPALASARPCSSVDRQCRERISTTGRGSGSRPADTRTARNSGAGPDRARHNKACLDRAGCDTACCDTARCDTARCDTAGFAATGHDTAGRCRARSCTAACSARRVGAHLGSGSAADGAGRAGARKRVPEPGARGAGCVGPRGSAGTRVRAACGEHDESDCRDARAYLRARQARGPRRVAGRGSGCGPAHQSRRSRSPSGNESGAGGRYESHSPAQRAASNAERRVAGGFFVHHGRAPSPGPQLPRCCSCGMAFRCAGVRAGTCVGGAREVAEGGGPHARSYDSRR